MQSGTSGTTGETNKSILETCIQLLGEVRHGLEEQKKIKEDVRRMLQGVSKVEENIKELKDKFKDFSEQSFTIESSCYKVSMK